jgi:hypothetical protein
VPGSPQRVRGARRWRVSVPLVLGAVLAIARPSVAVENGPQGVVRQFCQADALGRRVNVGGWSDFAPIVGWSFEPAWDSVALISGYAVGAPRPSEGTALEVDVRYTVIGHVSALGFDTDAHVETVTLRVHAPEDGWRIVGPPPTPHLFGSRVDIEAMRRSFEHGALNFLPNSLFVWQMFRSAGWNVPFQPTADLLGGTVYRAVERPRVGDVVVYLRDGVAYHAGLLEGENQVVSSTLNAGIVRTGLDAFAGDIRYARLIKPGEEPTPSTTAPTRPVLRATPAPAKKPTVNPHAKGSKHGPQPSPPPHVKAVGEVTPPPRRRPGTPRVTP